MAKFQKLAIFANTLGDNPTLMDSNPTTGTKYKWSFRPGGNTMVFPLISTFYSKFVTRQGIGNAGKIDFGPSII